MNKLLLTPTEAAHALGIGRSKVYELMQTGQLASVHIGASPPTPSPRSSSSCAQPAEFSTDATHQRPSTGRTG